MALMPRDMPSRTRQQRRGIPIEVATTAQAQPKGRERIDSAIEPRTIGARMLQEQQPPTGAQNALEFCKRWQQQRARN